MNPAPSSAVLVAARLLLGAVFVYLGLEKALDPIGFLKLVREFHVLETAPGLNAVAALVPWFEVFCGSLLLLGVRPRAAALMQLLLLLAFTSLVLIRAFSLYRTGTTAFCAIRFDCGCGLGEVLVCMKLAENAGLALLAGLVAASPCDRLCLLR